MAKKKRKGRDKKHKASRSAQGKQRQDRRDGWATSRRQGPIARAYNTEVGPLQDVLPYSNACMMQQYKGVTLAVTETLGWILEVALYTSNVAHSTDTSSKSDLDIVSNTTE
ncbi:hypothetical protein HaLaN_07575, partial [Haematococcus lacustris]